jgi:hypothetical protein
VKVSISVSFASVRGKTNMVFSVMISLTAALLFFGIVKYEVDAMDYGYVLVMGGCHEKIYYLET